MKRLMECVPNYSEGRDKSVIDAIANAIAAEGVKILNVDPGEGTNRTVITFIGEPDVVCEAAFQGAKKSQELIDMRLHHGIHPRSGATDVLPLVPVSGITLQECAGHARALAKRLWEELGNPCYCYEAAAFKPEHKNLASCRAGEYEALPWKMLHGDKPDFGPADGQMNETIAKCGASNVGARNYLIAVNFNLNTKDTELAMEVARAVREKGHAGVPGTLKGCKANGWYFPEYGIAQVTMNITDIDATPLHVAFDEVSAKAEKRGIKVTGTEIIGMVPKRVLIEAGRHYLQNPSASEARLVAAAVERMNLSDLRPYDPRKRVIEYLMESL